jgi:hypothetical protein
MKLVWLIKIYLNEICGKLYIGKSLFCISYSEWSEVRRFFIAIAFQLCLECAIRKDVNVLDKIIHTIKRNIEVILEDSKEIGLGVNSEETKYMFMSHHQNAIQNHNLMINNEFPERVVKLKYFGVIVTNHN